MEWVFGALTAGFACWLVILLLDFNKPANTLRERVNKQEVRANELGQRLAKAQEEREAFDIQFKDLRLQWDALEKRRQSLLERANKRRLVLVPAGSFMMGSRFDDSPRNERPVHTVHLDAYYIGPTPVTNLDYREFINCTGHRAPVHWQQGSFPTGAGSQPVTNVAWQDAQAFAQWADVRLPTEAEWERAARGDDERMYPWGPRWIDERCNAGNTYGTLLPVDEFPAGRSPYGMWDMAGNAYEWCLDFYAPSFYHESPASNPRGPESGQERTIRGGFYGETRAGVRTTHRACASEQLTRESIGFRVAMDA
jgi:formylglycine-generating enzyme